MRIFKFIQISILGLKLWSNFIYSWGESKTNKQSRISLQLSGAWKNWHHGRSQDKDLKDSLEHRVLNIDEAARRKVNLYRVNALLKVSVSETNLIIVSTMENWVIGAPRTSEFIFFFMINNIFQIVWTILMMWKTPS